MAEELRTNKAEIYKLSQQIISNSKDQKWAKDMVAELLRLQKQDDEMNKEIDIPISEVQETADFGPFCIKRTIRGYLFQCKGGLDTFVSINFGGLCSILQMAMDSKNRVGDPDIPDEDKEWDRYFIECVADVMQAPLFAAQGWSLPAHNKPIDTTTLFNLGGAILRDYRRFCEEHYINAKPVPETEEDIKENIQMERQAEFIQQLAEAPLPPEDTPTED